MASESETYKPIEYPELFIGLIGPVGTNLKQVCEILSSELKKVGYRAITIKLSDALLEVSEGLEVKIKEQPADERISSYMNAGNALREQTGHNDALATLAIGQIREKRKQENGSENSTLEKTAFIFNSIKSKEELETFREVYGDNFFAISVYSQKEDRKEFLAKRIAESKRDSTNKTKYYGISEDLIHRDIKEENISHGQNVRGSFPLADVFIEDNLVKAKKAICRFIELLFGYQFYTPNKDEMAMYQAFGIALRSSDLSRQVGAAIINMEGDIITHGCNEVPKYGGGIYWEDDELDGRDFALNKYDSSAAMKEELLTEVIDRFLKEKILKVKKGESPEELTEQLLFGDKEHVLKNTTITSILEYGRIVHAEMNAITDAAKRGLILKDSFLYCTTYPCHICARHIIASGIRKVVYIEPYPKSMAADLYPDSIRKDPKEVSDTHVDFVPFVGIAPRRFKDFFGMVKRKDKKGNIIEWQANKAKPIIKSYFPTYLNHESKRFALLLGLMKEKKITSY